MIGHTMPDMYQKFHLTVDLGWTPSQPCPTRSAAAKLSTVPLGSDGRRFIPTPTRRVVLRGLETDEAVPLLVNG
jgi:hypothetical protein